MAPKAVAHVWAFRARFRARGFGWKSQPPIAALKNAVKEIKRAAKDDAVLAAEGAVLLIEKLSPALENVDSSSGAMGSAVARALDELVGVITQVDVPEGVRQAWLEQIWTAIENDHMPYLEALLDLWGEVCVSPQIASRWADRFLPMARTVLSQKGMRGYTSESTACLSALVQAGRHHEVDALLVAEGFWPYKRWEVLSKEARGLVDDAIACAEAARSPWTDSFDVARLCERMLLESDRADEAYARYAIEANQRSTYVGTFKAIREKYPKREAAQVLADLVASSPTERGKWFAAAKDAGLFDEALTLAGSSVDPKTLARAARDHVKTQPGFSRRCGMLALYAIAEGYGYEITSLDVDMAFNSALAAAEAQGNREETREEIRAALSGYHGGDNFVTRVLRNRLRPNGS